MEYRLIISLLFLISFRVAASDFYVATNGSDANPGSLAQPFLTINAARDACRALGTNVSRTINIRGGKYFNVAVTLQRESGADDSGLIIRGYQNETAILYGGMPITNWASISNGWFMASLPSFPNLETNVSSLTNWQSRMLLVDGVMADRSQYPTNTYSLYYTNKEADAERQSLKYTNSDLGSWLVCTNAEIQIDYSWDQQTTGISSIDTNTYIATLYPTLRTDSGHVLGFTGVNSYRIYNIQEGMSHEGQFYYDRGSQSMVYWPRAAKDPNTSECVVPTTTRVFYINGRQLSRPWGITISNLTIQVGTADLVNEGDYGFLWDNFSLVQALYCDGLTFNNINIGNTVGNAIGMQSNDSTNTLLQNSIIHDCGAGGAAIRGGPCVISNNLFQTIAGVCFQSRAVRVARAGVVVRNDIFDCKTCAIGDAFMHDSIISQNHISNAVQVLRDMGAFYCYFSYSNIVTSNWFDRIGLGFQGDGSDARDYYRNPIYFDEQTSNSFAAFNITINSHMTYFCNAAHDNTVLNNVFINTNGEYLRIFSSPGSRRTTFERNVALCSTNILVDNSTNFVSWSSNVLWSTYSPPLTNNIPSGATVSDPLFNNIATMDIGFQGGSPCPPLGILPLSISDIGRFHAPSGTRTGTIKTVRAATVRGL